MSIPSARYSMPSCWILLIIALHLCERTTSLPINVTITPSSTTPSATPLSVPRPSPPVTVSPVSPYASPIFVKSFRQFPPQTVPNMLHILWSVVQPSFPPLRSPSTVPAVAAPSAFSLSSSRIPGTSSTSQVDVRILQPVYVSTIDAQLVPGTSVATLLNFELPPSVQEAMARAEAARKRKLRITAISSTVSAVIFVLFILIIARFYRSRRLQHALASQRDAFDGYYQFGLEPKKPRKPLSALDDHVI